MSTEELQMIMEHNEKTFMTIINDLNKRVNILEDKIRIKESFEVKIEDIDKIIGSDSK